MRTVTPCIFSISSGAVSPTYESMDFYPLAIMLMSSFSWQWATLHILPPFTPTPWMLERHADKDPEGDQPWKIYAWCVRDIISRYGQIEQLDERLVLQDRLNFYRLMSGEIDKAEINGQIFSYKTDDEPDQSLVVSQISGIRRKSTVTYNVD